MGNRCRFFDLFVLTAFFLHSGQLLNNPRPLAALSLPPSLPPKPSSFPMPEPMQVCFQNPSAAQQTAATTSSTLPSKNPDSSNWSAIRRQPTSSSIFVSPLPTVRPTPTSRTEPPIPAPNSAS